MAGGANEMKRKKEKIFFLQGACPYSGFKSGKIWDMKKNITDKSCTRHIQRQKRYKKTNRTGRTKSNLDSLVE